MKSLKINLPIGQVLFQSLAWLVLFCVVIELFARTSVGGNLFKYETYGSSHPNFDPQVVRIKAREAKDGHIDCIFLGDSQILYGVDPATVEKAYFEQTGKSIRCQNFGLGGLKPSTSGALASILIQNFHPSLIVYGTDMFDYTASYIASDLSIMTSPWVKYQLGDFSIDGWLIEYSKSYRYYLGADRYLLDGDELADDIGSDGRSLKFAEQTKLSQKEQEDYFSSLMAKPEITGDQWGGLHDLLVMNSKDVKIVIIETPVNPLFFTDGKYSYNSRIYPDFRNILENETSDVKTGLWLTQDSVQIPEDGWYDLVHLNQTGTLYFSQLLGEFLAGL